MNVVELSGVCFERGGRDILKDITWAIQSRAHCALLGPNGSGKTTLLKVITGYEWATHGAVKVLGKRFGSCNLPALRKTIGWVSAAVETRMPPRDTALRIAASGFEASFGLYRRLTRREFGRARDALASMGVDHLSERPYGRLSQGEQQRVLIARALVPDPALLVLDEPCVGLDPVARADFLDDLGRLASEPEAPTLVYVTHHIEEVGPWIRQVAVMKQGTILATGTPETVLTGPVLGEAFSRPCTVTHDGGQYRLKLDSHNR
ncbi:MAG: ABC transporter ATP-binding protein [Candidatus Hydrogenedentes bacterium]|nr:ABC transporter ATP-binding protein [Candidatus Hydrogenedentota bacterium]